MIEINAITLDGRKMIFKGNRNTNVIDMKKRLKEALSHSEKEITLMYHGTILKEDTMTLMDYDIVANSTIGVIYPLRAGTKVFAKTEDNKTISFEVLKTDRIIDVKKKITDKTALDPSEQRLVLNGITLEDEKTCSDYEIVDNCIINVITKKKNEMQIFAKTMDGKTVGLEIGNTDLIIDVKNKIQVKIGLLPDEQKIIYNGVMLEDNKTVESYHIVEKSVINVVARLRGGRTLAG